MPGRGGESSQALEAEALKPVLGRLPNFAPRKEAAVLEPGCLEVSESPDAGLLAVPGSTTSEPLAQGPLGRHSLGPRAPGGEPLQPWRPRLGDPGQPAPSLSGPTQCGSQHRSNLSSALLTPNVCGPQWSHAWGGSGGWVGCEQAEHSRSPQVCSHLGQVPLPPGSKF